MPKAKSSFTLEGRSNACPVLHRHSPCTRLLTPEPRAGRALASGVYGLWINGLISRARIKIYNQIATEFPASTRICGVHCARCVPKLCRVAQPYYSNLPSNLLTACLPGYMRRVFILAVQFRFNKLKEDRVPLLYEGLVEYSLQGAMSSVADSLPYMNSAIYDLCTTRKRNSLLRPLVARKISGEGFLSKDFS